MIFVMNARFARKKSLGFFGFFLLNVAISLVQNLTKTITGPVFNESLVWRRVQTATVRAKTKSFSLCRRLLACFVMMSLCLREAFFCLELKGTEQNSVVLEEIENFLLYEIFIEGCLQSQLYPAKNRLPFWFSFIMREGETAFLRDLKGREENLFWSIF